MKVEVYKPMEDAISLSSTPEGRRLIASMIVDKRNLQGMSVKRTKLITEIENLSAYMALNTGRISEQRMKELSMEMKALERELESIKAPILSKEEEEILITEQVAILEAEEEYKQILQKAEQQKQEKIGKARHAREQAIAALRGEQQKNQEQEKV